MTSHQDLGTGAALTLTSTARNASGTYWKCMMRGAPPSASLQSQGCELIAMHEIAGEAMEAAFCDGTISHRHVLYLCAGIGGGIGGFPVKPAALACGLRRDARCCSNVGPVPASSRGSDVHRG